MSEIFVEEENTVYEVDEECLKKRQQEKKQAECKKNYKAQDMGACSCPLWILLIFCLCR